MKLQTISTSAIFILSIMAQFIPNKGKPKSTPTGLYVARPFPSSPMCALIQSSPGTIFHDGGTLSNQLALNSSSGSLYLVFGTNTCDNSGIPVRVVFD